MRKTVITAVCGASMGAVLSHMGFSYLMWEFWAVVLLMLAYATNLIYGGD